MKYNVDVSRESEDWLATGTNLEGVSTWATTFANLDRNGREAIALAEDLPEGAESSLTISWSVPTDSHPELDTAIQIAQQRRDLVQAQQDLEPKVRSAISALTQAVLLGMTAGRVSPTHNPGSRAISLDQVSGVLN